MRILSSIAPALRSIFGRISCVVIILLIVNSALASEVPVRFILTFDDGPSTRDSDNPTEHVLDVLARNPIQNNIKAVFFTQTRLGVDEDELLTEKLLRRENDEGHLLAIHTGKLKHHSDHRRLGEAELDAFLVDAKMILQQITGTAPQLVRPPYWDFDERTEVAYEKNGLHMLLTDVSVSDGKTWGYRANPRRRGVLHREMEEVNERIKTGEIPIVDGLFPIVVTFHDTNTWTAAHMTEYLELLVSSANESGLTLDSQPFYGNREQIKKAGVQRSIQEKYPHSLVPSKWPWPFRQ